MADASTIVDYNRKMALETENLQLNVQLLEEGVRAVLNDSSLGRYFVATCDGDIIGQMLITYEWSDWRNGLIWWIQSVYVAAHARKQGVYRAIHEQVRKLASSTENVVGIRLYVDKENHTAQAVYRQVGMEPTSYLMFEECWANSPKKEE